MRDQRLKEIAENNHKYRKETFTDEIKFSCDRCKVYGEPMNVNYDIGKPELSNTRVNIIGEDIKTYMLGSGRDLEGKTAVLNFASYKNPGGGYMSGMMAQEEALCHFTTLYEVISRQYDYYEWNNAHKNKGMYRDRILYAPGILTLDANNDIVDDVDVITCAAPNMSLGLRYGSFTEEQCQRVFYDRALLMFHVAAYNQVDNLILGAWGCGVFRNDPTFVAKSLFALHEIYKGYFRNVLYVIPKGDNYDTFLRVASTDLEG